MKMVIFLVPGLFLFAFTIYWQIYTDYGFVWRSYQMMHSEPPMKTLLLWTPWWKGYLGASEFTESWGIVQFYNWTEHKHVDLKDFGCDDESYRCAITSNRSLLPDQSLYDGVLFHQFDTNQEDIPDIDKRRVNQNYIYHTMETPKDGQIPSMPNNFFNATMTYHSQSKIYIPYGRVVKIADPPTGRELDEYIAEFGKQYARNMTGKDFSSTLLMSSCGSWSDRDRLLADLRKMMPVDIYGVCGKPVPNDKDAGNRQGTDDTHIMLGKTYPFYLAFENSLCEDYVTEKFFSSLNSNMIPVSYNGANMSRIAPTHSYIDVRDFKTVGELGKYLQEVHANPSLYASYFWWRDFYKVEYVGRHFFKTFTKVFCEACRYLHTGRKARIVESLEKDWVEGKCIKPPVINYL